MTNHWLRLVGPPALFEGDTNEIVFPTKKQLALLVYLALDSRGRQVHRDRMIDLLWSGVPPERGRHSLSQGLSEIRRRVGADWVNRGSDFVVLLRDVPTDVEDLALLQSRMFRQPQILDGFELLAGPEFAHWVDSARTRLVRLLTKTLNLDIDIQRKTGNDAVVRERAEQLYEVNPGSVRAVSILCEHAAASGDVARARHLIEGVIAHRELRSGDREFEALRKLRLRIERLGTSRAPGRHRATGPRLFGRESLLRELNSQILDGRTADTHTVLLTGVPGVGKTAVLHRFASTARTDGHVCIETKCAETDADFSIITNCSRQLMAFGELGTTDPTWFAELASFAPFLRVKYPGIPAQRTTKGLPPSPVTAALALNCAFASVASERSVLLILDDVNHLDKKSREVLNSLIDLVSGYQLFVLGAGQITQHLSGSTTWPIDSRHWDEVIAVPPLCQEQSRALIESELTGRRPGATTLERLSKWSLGLPMFAKVLAAGVRKDGERTAISELTKGTWQLSSGCRARLQVSYRALWSRCAEALDFLCLMREPARIGLLAKLCRTSVSQMEAELGDGLDRGVLDVTGGSFAFSSPVYRSYVYGSMTPARGRYCHEMIATVLQRDEQPSRANQHEIRFHRRQAGLERRVHQGNQARSQRSRASLGSIATDKARPIHWSYQDEMTLLAAGERAARMRNWNQLQAIAHNAFQTPPVKRAPRYLASAFFRMTNGNYDLAAQDFRQCVLWWADGKEVINLARAYNGLGTCALAMGRYTPAVTAFSTAYELAHRCEPAFAAAVASNIGVASSDYDFQKKAARWFTLSMETFKRLDHHPYRATVLANYIDHKLVLGDTDGARDAWTSVGGITSAADPISAGYLLCARADLLLAEGRVDSACECILEAEHAFDSGGQDEHRFVMGFDSPHMARLSYVRAWFTEEDEAYNLMERTWPTSSMPISQQAELLALFEWRRGMNGDHCTTGRTPAFEARRFVRRTGTFGVLRRLKVVGLLGNALHSCVS